MRKKNYLRFVLCFGLAVCSVFVFRVCAKAFDVVIPTPNSNQPDATAMIKELNIIPNYAILEGQTLQMQIEDFNEFIILNSVEWSSSKPDVISCTKKAKSKDLKKVKQL